MLNSIEKEKKKRAYTFYYVESVNKMIRTILNSLLDDIWWLAGVCKDARDRLPECTPGNIYTYDKSFFVLSFR